MRNVWQSFVVALEMLRMHKLRAFLTMLGVIIGVMSVTIIIMLSNGFQAYLSNQFRQIGANTITIVYAPSFRSRGQSLGTVEGLTMQDVRMIRDRIPALELVAPMVQGPTQKVVYEDKNFDNARLFGGDPSSQMLNATEVTKGRLLSQGDIDERANVCIIGEDISKRLFPNDDPIGKRIVLSGITSEVIGVSKPVTVFGESTGKDVMMPFTTLQKKLIGGDKVTFIQTRPKPGNDMNVVMDDIWEVLMERSKNRPVYRVDSNESILKTFNSIFGVAGIALSAIAALSLLVGGIGIMNIMLVSVTERTKEIGLRKSVGAKRKLILTQFVIEAATLSLVGGLIGMGIAYGMGSLVTVVTAMNKWPNEGGLPTPFPLTAGIFAAAFSAMIGMVFGFYPAFTASRLDPIVALRTE